MMTDVLKSFFQKNTLRRLLPILTRINFSTNNETKRSFPRQPLRSQSSHNQPSRNPPSIKFPPFSDMTQQHHAPRHLHPVSTTPPSLIAIPTPITLSQPPFIVAEQNQQGSASIPREDKKNELQRGAPNRSIFVNPPSPPTLNSIYLQEHLSRRNFPAFEQKQQGSMSMPLSEEDRARLIQIVFNSNPQPLPSAPRSLHWPINSPRRDFVMFEQKEWALVAVPRLQLTIFRNIYFNKFIVFVLQNDPLLLQALQRLLRYSPNSNPLPLPYEQKQIEMKADYSNFLLLRQPDPRLQITQDVTDLFYYFLRIFLQQRPRRRVLQNYTHRFLLGINNDNKRSRPQQLHIEFKPEQKEPPSIIPSPSQRNIITSEQLRDFNVLLTLLVINHFGGMLQFLQLIFIYATIFYQSLSPSEQKTPATDPVALSPTPSDSDLQLSPQPTPLCDSNPSPQSLALPVTQVLDNRPPCESIPEPSPPRVTPPSPKVNMPPLFFSSGTVPLHCIEGYLEIVPSYFLYLHWDNANKKGPILVQGSNGYSLNYYDGEKWQLKKLADFKMPSDWEGKQKVIVSLNNAVFKVCGDKFPWLTPAEKKQPQPNIRPAFDINNIEVNSLAAFIKAFESWENKDFTTTQRNQLFEKFNKSCLEHKNPRFDKHLGIINTTSYKHAVANIRNKAFTKLENEINDIQKNHELDSHTKLNSIINKLQMARTMSIFKEHSSNHLKFSFVHTWDVPNMIQTNTKTVIKINKMLEEYKTEFDNLLCKRPINSI